MVDSSGSACGVVKVSARSRKETAWLDIKVDEAVKEKSD